MRVGFIGLGHMGEPMCRNVLKAGYPLTVHDRRAEAVDALVEAGAAAATTTAACAAASDVLITMLPGPRQVESVLLDDGAAAALPSDAVWVDMSTSVPATARRVGAVLVGRGASWLDAPVSGMARGAAAGTLQIFVGGPAEVYARSRPVLAAMGDPERIFHVGPHGAGYTVKLMVNLLWFAHLVATAEVLTIGVKAGVALPVLRQALLASPARSHFLEHDVLSVFDGDYDESFAMALACKDLLLAVELSRDVGVPVELSALVEQIYRRAAARYGERAGEMVPMKLYEDLAGIKLRASADVRGVA